MYKHHLVSYEVQWTRIDLVTLSKFYLTSRLFYKFKNLRNIKNMLNIDLHSKLLNQFPDDPAIKMKNDHRLQYLKLKQYSFHPFSNFLRFSGVIKTFFNLWLDVNVFKYFSDQLNYR